MLRKLEEFILEYAYVLLFLGVIIEGETPLVIASVMANQNYLNLTPVILIGFFSALLGDQLCFLLARTKGKYWLQKSTFLSKRMEKIIRMIQNNDVYVILIMRFLYGLRILVPFFLGLTNIGWKRYFIFNLIGVTIWIIVFATVGHTLAKGTDLLFEGQVNFELILFVSLFSILIVFLFLKAFNWVWNKIHRTVSSNTSNSKD